MKIKLTSLRQYLLSHCSALVLCVGLLPAAYAEVLSVGPGKQFISPAVAATFAVDGDIVEIDGSGIYQGDVAIWKQNNLIIRGINGRPHLQAAGKSAGQKGIWVIKGNNVLVENVEFSGAKVPDKNGAGIRLEGTHLTIRNCYFHHNENGILSGKDKESIILIEHSEFQENGAGDGQSHNIYIGAIKELVLRFNTFRGAKIGHNVKSRAARNIIKYNIIRDGANGTASYQVDLSNGGYSVLVGNSIQQGQYAENYSLIAYGMEGLKNSDNRLYMANNTLVNDRHNGVFVKTAKGSEAWLYNNLFVGKGKMLEGPAQASFNLATESPGFVARMRGDYRLTADSPSIDKGSAEVLSGENDLLPRYLPSKDLPLLTRDIQGALDIGAYEFRVLD
ncbi:MAG: right-handed parallel beta-helix repeat-containing protein [Gammaproteobacteria bacterium]|nr:right-handed parallel beta-helix repeat-containing protein [Gammaproteobacteria bacterium]